MLFVSKIRPATVDPIQSVKKLQKGRHKLQENIAFCKSPQFFRSQSREFEPQN